MRAAPPPHPAPVTRGPRLGRPVGRGASRDAASRSPAPAGLLLRPPAGFHHVARARARARGRHRRRLALPSLGRGREKEEEGGARAGEEREGKGARGGRKGARGRDPSHVTPGPPGKLRGGAWRRHFPCSSLSLWPDRAPADPGQGVG